VWWLSIPVIATVLAALWTWVRNRPEPVPTTRQGVRSHLDYLDALGQRPRSQDLGLVSPSPSPPADPTGPPVVP
jgi:hypothetical protein